MISISNYMDTFGRYSVETTAHQGEVTPKLRLACYVTYGAVANTIIIHCNKLNILIVSLLCTLYPSISDRLTNLLYFFGSELCPYTFLCTMLRFLKMRHGI